MRKVGYLIAFSVMVLGVAFFWNTLRSHRLPSTEDGRLGQSVQQRMAERQEQEQREWQERLADAPGLEISGSDAFKMQFINSLKQTVLPEDSARSIPQDLEALSPEFAHAMALRFAGENPRTLDEELEAIGITFQAGSAEGFVRPLVSTSPSHNWRKADLENSQIVYFRPQDIASAEHGLLHPPRNLLESIASDVEIAQVGVAAAGEDGAVNTMNFFLVKRSPDTAPDLFPSFSASPGGELRFGPGAPMPQMIRGGSRPDARP